VGVDSIPKQHFYRKKNIDLDNFHYCQLHTFLSPFLINLTFSFAALISNTIQSKTFIFQITFSKEKNFLTFISSGI